jgi:hypothetical protein
MFAATSCCCDPLVVKVLIGASADPMIKQSPELYARLGRDRSDDTLLLSASLGAEYCGLVFQRSISCREKTRRTDAPHA